MVVNKQQKYLTSPSRTKKEIEITLFWSEISHRLQKKWLSLIANNFCGFEMDLESVKRFLEKEGGPYESSVDSLPERFFEPFVAEGLKIDLIEPGRIVCSLNVPPRLLNMGNSLHGGATATLVDLVGSAVLYTVGDFISGSGVSVEINVSYLDGAYLGEEIEIEGKALRIGKAVAVISVELRKKKTGKIIAHGRHTKYLPVSSKL